MITKSFALVRKQLLKVKALLERGSSPEGDGPYEDSGRGGWVMSSLPPEFQMNFSRTLFRYPLLDP